MKNTTDPGKPEPLEDAWVVTETTKGPTKWKYNTKGVAIPGTEYHKYTVQLVNLQGERFTMQNVKSKPKALQILTYSQKSYQGDTMPEPFIWHEWQPVASTDAVRSAFSHLVKENNAWKKITLHK